MLISASRRTDIPAFYSEWFINRVRAGFVLIRNPFNAHQVKRVSLRGADVTAVVFWTRNPEPLLPYLDELVERGINFYFQYTITGYPRAIEKSVPKPARAIERFKELSDKIGSGRVIWRYDPILLSNLVGVDEHKRLFEKIARALGGKTKRVVISFSDMYRKVERNLNAVPGLIYTDVLAHQQELEALAKFMADVAAENAMEIESCAEEVGLDSFGISHGKCVDDQLIFREFGIKVPGLKDKSQRAECGCVKSVDIGQYNTCLHGCSYCYATFNEAVVLRSWDAHDPESPFLVGGVRPGEEHYLVQPSGQGGLFD